MTFEGFEPAALALLRELPRFGKARYAEARPKEDFDPKFILPFKMMRSPTGDLFSRGMNVMINKLIPEHCPISDESLQHYRDSLPIYRSRKALADFPKLLPLNGKPAASHDFAMELQAGLPQITFPVLWIQPEPGMIVSMVNPCGMKRIEQLSEVWPQMVVRDFGEGYHFLSEENPDRVVEMLCTWVRELETTRRSRVAAES